MNFLMWKFSFEWKNVVIVVACGTCTSTKRAREHEHESFELTFNFLNMASFFLFFHTFFPSFAFMLRIKKWNPEHRRKVITLQMMMMRWVALACSYGVESGCERHKIREIVFRGWVESVSDEHTLLYGMIKTLCSLLLELISSPKQSIINKCDGFQPHTWQQIALEIANI